MGLFSGSFGTGLITGLASSIDKSLQTAMDKRDKEMSRARSFWETRQAQKMDLADAHDRRAKKALDRLIDEFDGDVASGLAAYKAIGGSVDSVEGYITELDETRKAGISYDIKQKFKFDNIDMNEFKELSREDALGSVRMEVPTLDIKMSDTSGLSKIGLGLKDVGKGISEKVNEMIPPRTYQAVEGLEVATFDPSGLKTGVEFDMKKQQFEASMKANSLDIKNQIKYNIMEINNLGDSPEDEANRIKLTKENEALFTVYDRFAAIDNRNKGGLTVSGMSSLYTSRMDQLREDNQYGTVGNVASITVDGKTLTGTEATNKWNEIKLEEQSQYVEGVLLDDQGNYRGSKAEDMMSFMSIPQKAFEMAQARINKRTKKPAEGDGAVVTDTGDGAVVTDTGEGAVVGTGEGDKPEADQTSFVVGTNDTEVVGAKALYDFIASDPEDYIQGVKDNFGEEFLSENMENYKTILESAKSNVPEADQEAYQAKIDGIISGMSQLKTSIASRMSNVQGAGAPIVLTLPETFKPTKVTKLTTDEGEFAGQYLYQDEQGGKYISPVRPATVGLTE
jgi:hypothetical protein